MSPKKSLRSAEKLLKETEELRNECARIENLVTCVQAGEKALGSPPLERLSGPLSLLVSRKSIKNTIR